MRLIFYIMSVLVPFQLSVAEPLTAIAAATLAKAGAGAAIAATTYVGAIVATPFVDFMKITFSSNGSLVTLKLKEAMKATEKGSCMFSAHHPDLKNVGINWVCVRKDNGFYYAYRIEVANIQKGKLTFYDKSGDYYDKSMTTVGSSYTIDYNSDRPDISIIHFTPLA